MKASQFSVSAVPTPAILLPRFMRGTLPQSRKSAQILMASARVVAAIDVPEYGSFRSPSR